MRRACRRGRNWLSLDWLPCKPNPQVLMTKHLIIGGGPAAINAIETIREFDGGASQVTLVSDEPAYARMVLPYYLAQRIPEKQVYTADDAYYDRLKVERHIGQRVARIDPAAKSA